MKPLKSFQGKVAPLQASNVDTDQIIPKQFLTRIERTGYEDALFFDWRFHEDGKLNADFEMNAPRYRDAKILLTKDNFGCGSSREHAPWALRDYGFVCILAPSFADIFFSNCFNNGMLPIVLPAETVDRLFNEVRANEGYALSVDVDAQTLTTPSGESISFDIPAYLKDRLLRGLDLIGVTLTHEDEIAAYEKRNGIASS